jgi:TM2 domain-containing membrane protein YozV
VLISYIFPAYFYAAILAQFYSVGGGWGHARSQLILFFNQYWPLIILLLVYLWRRARKQITYNQGEDLYLWVLLIAALCLIPLGLNTGSFLSYHYQMALPALIIIGLTSLSKLRSTVVRVFFIVAILIFSIFHGELLSYRPIYSEQALQKWNFANQIITSTEGPKLISSPILAPIMGESILLDNGHTEYYVGLKTPSALLDILLPRRYDYFSIFDQYFKGIESKIAQKEFKLIAITKDFHPMIPQLILEANYFKLETIDLQTGRQTWVTEFWAPKN